MSNNLYTDDEQAVLDKVKSVRIAIIDDMTKSGVPDNVGKIRVLNEVLASTDKMIADTATMRLKQEDNANKGAAVDMVVELLKQSRVAQAKMGADYTPPVIDSEATATETVDGEMDINPERLDPSDFVAPLFDPSKVAE